MSREEQLEAALLDLQHKVRSLTERVYAIERGGSQSSNYRKPLPATITQMESSLAEVKAMRERLLIKRRTVGHVWTEANQQDLDKINRIIEEKRKYIREYPHKE